MNGDLPAPDTNDHTPGDPGVWFFIIADMTMFAIFFLIFTVGRHQAPELYRSSQAHLDVRLGLANTLILMTSGACMAKATIVARTRAAAKTRQYILAALGVGALFGVSKVIEYRAKFEAGIAINTNEFFGYYFAFTGIHLLHWIVGCIILIALVRRLNGPAVSDDTVTWIESGAIYWHMVDLLWVMLFAMIYLFPAGAGA